MTTTETLETPATRVYARRKRHSIRRRIRHEGVLQGNVHQFACYSMTREGHGVLHHQEIDLETGHVQCSCEHFTFRKAARGANLVTWIEGNDSAPCKHLGRASEWLLRHGYFDHLLNIRLRPCISCGVADAEHEHATESGHATGHFICADCVTRARMMGEPGPQTNYRAGDDLSYEQVRAREAAHEAYCDEMMQRDNEPAVYKGYDEWLDEMEEGEEWEPVALCPCCNRGARWEEGEDWSGVLHRLYCDECGDVTDQYEKVMCE